MARVAPAIVLDADTRAVLHRWAHGRSTPQAQALRSRIILRAASEQSNRQIAAEFDIPEVTVGKWRRSFAAQGLEGLQECAAFGPTAQTRRRGLP